LVGHKTEFQWAVYESAGERMRDPRLTDGAPLCHGMGNIVKSDGTRDGLVHSPFWIRDEFTWPSTLRYLQQLTAWRDAMRPQLCLDILVSDPTNTHQVGVAQDVRKLGRQHRLIQDAKSDSYPQGYFDCTVEVRHIFPRLLSVVSARDS
jgi:hypothetical protein